VAPGQHAGYPPDETRLLTSTSELSATPVPISNQKDSSIRVSSPEPRSAPEKDFYTTDAFAEWAVIGWGGIRTSLGFSTLRSTAIHAPHEATEKYLQRFSAIADPQERTMAAMISAMMMLWDA